MTCSGARNSCPGAARFTCALLATCILPTEHYHAHSGQLQHVCCAWHIYKQDLVARPQHDAFRHPEQFMPCRLEELLAEKLALVNQTPSGQAGWAQLQLSVDAHRQVSGR
jgi:hypothetical protein